MFGILSRDVCNVVDVRCADYGRKCEDEADPVPRQAKVFEAAEKEQIGETYQTQSLSNSKAWKDHPENPQKERDSRFFEAQRWA